MPETRSDRLRNLVALTMDRGRPLFAFLLVVHGAAHLVGTRGAMQAMDAEPLEYLFGAWSISATWLLVVFASLWGIVSAGFAIAGWLVYMEAVSWRSFTWALALTSLILTVIALPMAWIGAAVNVVLLALTWTVTVPDEIRDHVPQFT